MSDDLTIGESDRVTFFGRTGTGKTYLARALLRADPDLVIVDGKGTIGPVEWGAELITLADFITRPDPIGRVIVRPDPTPADVDTLGRAIQGRSALRIYADELYFVFENNRDRGAWAPLWTRGRELGLSVWGSVQRPTWVPLYTISEADHYFIFRLRLDRDRDRAAEVAGLDRLPRLPDRHSFAYAAPEHDRVIVYKQFVWRGGD